MAACSPASPLARPSSRYILPQFEERTSYGMKRLDPYTKLFEDRIIFLGVQVDDASADDIIAQLIVLESPGPGPRHPDVHQLARWLVHRLTAIYDTMQYVRPDIQTFVPRPGGLGRRRAARRGRTRASGSPCRTPAS